MTIGSLVGVSKNEHAMIRERDAALDELHRAGLGVTVAIPCYNQPETLGLAVRSALEQTCPPYEIIIVDDGSTVPVAPPPGGFLGDSKVPVRVIRVTNRGLAAARNTALMNTVTQWFLPLDADDWIDPEYIAKTIAAACETGAEVILTGLQEHGPTRNGTYMPGFDRPWSQVTPELILDQYNRFFYCSLFSTEVLRAAGGYNPKMSEGLEDADLWVTLLDAGVRLAAVEEPLFHYNTSNPNGMLRTIHANGGYERMVEEMRRHRLPAGRD